MTTILLISLNKKISINLFNKLKIIKDRIKMQKIQAQLQIYSKILVGQSMFMRMMRLAIKKFQKMSIKCNLINSFK